MLPRLLVALTTLLSLAYVVSAIPANVDRLYPIGPRDAGRKCGNDLTPEDVSEKEKAFASLLAQNKAAEKVTAVAGNFTIPVIFNVVYASMNISDGYVPDSQVQAQIDVMNQDYNGTGLSFQLQNITRTLNATWFNNAAPNVDVQTDMKNALRQGDVKTLNIYTVGFTSSSALGLLGYSTFPADYAGDPMNDGVVILYSSLPGGSEASFNLGRTSTHEVGHWVGLYHPFQGGCDGPGDYVDDTPAEAIPAAGCPIGRDTCSSPGLDPVQNYMDYSNDACMNNFTPGQIARLQSQIQTYRGIQL
ncbi:metalloprotease [Thelephora terrestris]|uniref:Metalloprotease n=1 Tax=Thelephora terrestris TaxID=56493 RepID=A0A9P6HJT2_9AGAM|nr:metalloprotease [Thelephora terrestris]